MLFMEIKGIVFGMKVISGVLQFGGLVVASRIDLRTKAVELAEEAIPVDDFVNQYRSVTDDVPYVPSKEKLHHAHLASLNDSLKNAKLFKWSIWMVGAGMLIQLLADIIDPG